MDRLIRYELYHAAFEKEPVLVAIFQVDHRISGTMVSEDDNKFLLERIFDKTQSGTPDRPDNWTNYFDPDLEVIKRDARSTSVGDFVLRITPASTSRWDCAGSGWRKA